MRPISLKLRHAEILAQARSTLIRDGRGEELKQATLRKARRMVSEAQEQKPFVIVREPFEEQQREDVSLVILDLSAQASVRNTP